MTLPWRTCCFVIAAMLLTAASLGAVFADHAWFAQVAAVVVGVAVAGAVSRSVGRLQELGLVVLPQGLVALVLVLALTVHDTFALGLVPTPGTVVGLFDLLGTGLDDVYSTSAPAESTEGFRALLVCGFAVITVLVDGLVSDLRTPTAGGVLLLLVYMVPVVLAAAQLRWWHFAAVAAAFLVLLLSRYADAPGLRGPVTAAGAGGLALLVGVLVPLALPPITPKAPTTTPTGDITVVNPFLDLGEDLRTGDDEVVLRYTTDDPLAPPLRLTSVSEFDGETWSPAPFDIDPFAVAVDGLAYPPGVSGDTHVVERRIDVEVDGLAQQHLPTPYSPALVDGASRRWIYDPATLTIVGNGEVTTGMSYGVDYRSVEPTPAQLAAAAPVEAAEFADTLALPDDLPAVVTDTAADVTAGTANPYEAAVALQDHFRSGEYEYSLDAPDVASGDALADFLADRRGYCVQFSGAMTAMARSIGIPARIAVGFTPGTPTGDGSYEISMDQAHAWPELWFEDVGWVRFEPTPGGPAGTPPPWTTEDGEDGSEEPAPTPTPTSETQEETAPAEEPTAEETAPAGAEESGEGNGGFSVPRWVWTTLLVVLAGGLLLALPTVLRRARRSSGLAAASPEAWWAEVLATARDAGAPLASTVTVAAHAESLDDALRRAVRRDLLDATEAEQARTGLEGIRTAVEAQRYAGAPDVADSDPTGRRAAVRALDTVLGA
ncbi:DUF3488 and transglutaminase-like domain-containing protein, partial [Brevibacterium litoralis]|uniref:transglutaminase family protein n=1 Tax=Brevibacterium litoralis TaxID=3138935 RepID=UPI0032EC4971